ncbi:hypothetical protein P692DRAFT_20641914, partial [Suillus brevipes Sb2]
KQKEAHAQNRHLTLEDLEDKWDCSIPLVDILVQKYHHTLVLCVYSHSFSSCNNARHDGKVWQLNDHHIDVRTALG